ncbi:MAG: hypothetical protein RLP44_20205 [Aggregatilineales bacterium]
MLILALNAVFAGIFLVFSRTAFLRARLFLMLGWNTVRAEVIKPDYRQNVESRRLISEGGRFFLGGLFWLIATLVAFSLGIYFSLEVVRLYV